MSKWYIYGCVLWKVNACVFVVCIYLPSFIYIASQTLYMAKHPQVKLSLFESEMAIHVKSFAVAFYIEN